MKLEVTFRLKECQNSSCNQHGEFGVENIFIMWKVENRDAFVHICGDSESSVKELFYAVWELFALYDGYFYTPVSYKVNNVKRDVEELYKLNLYIADEKWRDAATLLVRNERLLSEEIIMSYVQFRSEDRNSGKLNTELSNSFFYLLSESYSNILVDHRLSLLLHVCDGYVLNNVDDNGTIYEKFNLLIPKAINVEKAIYGLRIMGIDCDIYRMLSATRNELGHFVRKPNCTAEFIFHSLEESINALNWYLTYMIVLVLRITFLQHIGVNIEQDCKDYAMDVINDWVILSYNLTEKCKIPANLFIQELKGKGEYFI